MIPTEFALYEYTQYGKRQRTRYKMSAATAAERFTPAQNAVPIPGTTEIRHVPQTDAEIPMNTPGWVPPQGQRD